MKRQKHAGGRPPLPPKERRKNLIQFKCTDAEADAIYRGAVHAGLNVREYVMLLVDRAAPQVPVLTKLNGHVGLSNRPYP